MRTRRNLLMHGPLCSFRGLLAHVAFLNKENAPAQTFFTTASSNGVTAMLKQLANSVSRRAVLGIAGAILSLVLAADGALVSAGRADVAPANGLFQAIQASAQVALDGSVRLANDMRALYQLTHLNEITPQPQPATVAWPGSVEREKLFLCSESRPMKAPAKATI